MRSHRTSVLTAGGASVALLALVAAAAPAAAAVHAADSAEPRRTCTEAATGGSCLLESVSDADHFLFTVPARVKEVVVDAKAGASGMPWDSSEFPQKTRATVPATFEERVNADAGSDAISWSKAPSVPIPVDAGNGVIANVARSTGNVLVRSATGLAWDSTIVDQDRYGLGPGKTWGGASVDPSGGITVYLPGEGVFAYSSENRSGLRGYEGNDRFEVHLSNPGTTPARGEVPERQYFFSLFRASEYTTDYFDADGNVLTSISSLGVRTDRLYDPVVPNRLAAFAEGGRVVTTVEYLPGEIQLRRAGAAHARLVQYGGQVVEIVAGDGGRSVFLHHGRTLAAIESKSSTGLTEVKFAWDASDPKRAIQVTRNGEVVYEAR